MVIDLMHWPMLLHEGIIANQKLLFWAPRAVLGLARILSKATVSSSSLKLKETGLGQLSRLEQN